jgi:hypothetical protein
MRQREAVKKNDKNAFYRTDSDYVKCALCHHSIRQIKDILLGPPSGVGKQGFLTSRGGLKRFQTTHWKKACEFGSLRQKIQSCNTLSAQIL